MKLSQIVLTRSTKLCHLGRAVQTSTSLVRLELTEDAKVLERKSIVSFTKASSKTICTMAMGGTSTATETTTSACGRWASGRAGESLSIPQERSTRECGPVASSLDSDYYI